MIATKYEEQWKQACSELREHSPTLDSERFVGCLSSSLTRLRAALIRRCCDDVEEEFGKDSMVLSSLQEKERQSRRATTEIEAYCCILVNEEATQNKYLVNDDNWFLDWLLRFRFGKLSDRIKEERVSHYRSDTIQERRMKFVSLLHRSLPESARAPLVLFRLFPRSVRISAAMAFDDMKRAQVLRDEQVRLLPAITYCHECQGRLMDCDDSCRCCGNPVWTITWLQSE